MSDQDKMGEFGRILKGGPSGNGKAEAAKAVAVTEAPEADELIELPGPGSPYEAYARLSNKPVYALHCILGKDGVQTFEYVQKSDRSEFKAGGEHGQVIKLRFAGTKIWDVTITGINLWRLYDLIGQHRMAWIRKSDRGFSATPGKESLIMGIEIKEIERDQ